MLDTNNIRIQAAIRAVNAMPGETFVARETAMAAALSTRRGRLITAWRVNKWRVNGVPVGFVLDVEAVTGVERYDLAPAIYPKAA